MDFLKDIVKEIGDDFTQLASDIEDTERYVDTGSYIFNGLVSGSIFGGVSGNKITAIAGESSTGKTFFSLAVVKNFLDSNPDGYCLYFDTEAAVNKALLQSRGIDLNVKDSRDLGISGDSNWKEEDALFFNIINNSFYSFSFKT